MDEAATVNDFIMHGSTFSIVSLAASTPVQPAYSAFSAIPLPLCLYWEERGEGECINGLALTESMHTHT